MSTYQVKENKKYFTNNKYFPTNLLYFIHAILSKPQLLFFFALVKHLNQTLIILPSFTDAGKLFIIKMAVIAFRIACNLLNFIKCWCNEQILETNNMLQKKRIYNGQSPLNQFNLQFTILQASWRVVV